jgi:hypothetical protein
MRSSREWLLSLRELPPAQSLALTGIVSLLAVADWLPPNPYVDPDILEFLLSMTIGVWAMGLAALHRLEADQLTAWRNRLIASAVALIVALLSAEGATRYLYRDITTTADSGGYFTLRWAGSGLQENSFGMRERGFSLIKAAGVYRIVVQGDSFTFGNGLTEDQRYSNLLQHWLPAGFEVLNFGIPGHNTINHRHTLVSRVLPIRPDYVLLQWFVNDVEPPNAAERPHFLPLLPHSSVPGWVSQHSALYSVTNLRWIQWQIAAGFAPSYPDYLNAREIDPGGAAVRRERALLHEIVDTAHRGGAGFGMVLFPDAGFDLGTAYPFAYLHQRVTDACQDEAIRCLDLRTDFAHVRDRRTLWVNAFDHHPSARANEIAALKILEVFEPEWMKEKRP